MPSDPLPKSKRPAQPVVFFVVFEVSVMSVCLFIRRSLRRELSKAELATMPRPSPGLSVVEVHKSGIDGLFLQHGSHLFVDLLAHIAAGDGAVVNLHCCEIGVPVELLARLLFDELYASLYLLESVLLHPGAEPTGSALFTLYFALREVPHSHLSSPFCRRYALTVFCSSMVTVMGPTPPGTGVM